MVRNDTGVKAVTVVALQADDNSDTLATCNTQQHTTTHGSTLQHTATHCNTLQHAATCCNMLQHAATRCNTLQHATTRCNTREYWILRNHIDVTAVSVVAVEAEDNSDVRANCNTQQHTATHCSTPQHNSTLDIVQQKAIRYSHELQHTPAGAHCSTL